MKAQPDVPAWVTVQAAQLKWTVNDRGRTTPCFPTPIWVLSARKLPWNQSPSKLSMHIPKMNPKPPSKPGASSLRHYLGAALGLCDQPLPWATTKHSSVQQSTCQCFYWLFPHYLLVVYDLHQAEKSHCHHIAPILVKHIIHTVRVGPCPGDIWRLFLCLKKKWWDRISAV